MNKISFNEFKKNQIELYRNDVGETEIEQEMKMFQSQYDDGNTHTIETWDKWYDEFLEYL